jgi:hypothetical protein
VTRKQIYTEKLIAQVKTAYKFKIDIEKITVNLWQLTYVIFEPDAPTLM